MENNSLAVAVSPLPRPAADNYDDTNQLIGADHTSQADEEYEYDANGNRVMSGYTTGDTNQITSDGTYNYTYDAEGNRLTRTSIASGDVTRYVWDHRNWLVAVIQEDDEENVLSETTHTYDFQNRWISRTVDADGDGPGGSETTVFVHESRQIVMEFEGSAASDLSHRYLWGPSIDQLLAAEEVDSLFSEGEVLFPLSDHLGTTRDLAEYDSGLDTTTIASHRTFDSFGNITSETDTAVDLLFGYTGRPFDDSTGLQNNLHRWFDSQTGNWISEDPIGFDADDANLMRYVNNQITLLTDPSGLAPPLHPGIIYPQNPDDPNVWYPGRDKVLIYEATSSLDFKDPMNQQSRRKIRGCEYVYEFVRGTKRVGTVQLSAKLYRKGTELILDISIITQSNFSAGELKAAYSAIGEISNETSAGGDGALSLAYTDTFSITDRQGLSRALVWNENALGREVRPGQIILSKVFLGFDGTKHWVQADLTQLWKGYSYSNAGACYIGPDGRVGRTITNKDLIPIPSFDDRELFN